MRVLPRGGLNVKDGQPAGNEGSIGSPIQSSSPKVRVGSHDQNEILMKVSSLIILMIYWNLKEIKSNI